MNKIPAQRCAVTLLHATRTSAVVRPKFWTQNSHDLYVNVKVLYKSVLEGTSPSIE